MLYLKTTYYYLRLIFELLEDFEFTLNRHMNANILRYLDNRRLFPYVFLLSRTVCSTVLTENARQHHQRLQPGGVHRAETRRSVRGYQGERELLQHQIK